MIVRSRASRATRAESRPLPSTLNEQTSIETCAPVSAGSPAGKGPQSRFEAARHRLRAALGALDAAVHRQTELGAEQADQMAELAALQEDRSRLAIELDAAVEHIRELDAAGAEAAHRIERAASAVRAVLDADSAEERSAYAGDTAKDSQEA